MKDTAFIRGNVPMTKEEIRAIVLEKLELQSDDIFMDIGAGTGAVAIEAAFRLTQGNVIAIERKDEAVDLIRKNIRKHNLSNLKLLQALAPGGMKNLENINKYFIGGSGGNLVKILDLIGQKAPEGSIVVATAILIDTMYQAYHYFRDHSFEVELIQVSVNKAEREKKAGMLLAANPIFILTAKKKHVHG